MTPPPELVVIDPAVHLFIACPCYGQIEAGFVESIVKLTHHLAHRGISHSFAFLPGESLITRGRNRLVAQFLASQSTHLLFLDCDLTFPPETVTRLLDSGFDLVAAPYPVKAFPSRLVVNVKTFEEGGETKAVTRGDFVEAYEAATGCMLVSRHVFEVLAPTVPHVADDLIGSTHGRYGVYFDCGIDGERYLSEDYWFSRLWQSVGGTVWVDMHSHLKHTGKHSFTADSLAEQWAADLAAE